eukprot:4909541-Lingulodinium_polyedra.AAC.1
MPAAQPRPTVGDAIVSRVFLGPPGRLKRSCSSAVAIVLGASSSHVFMMSLYVRTFAVVQWKFLLRVLLMQG